MAAAEEAAWGECVTPREALKLVQMMNKHYEGLLTAVIPGRGAPNRQEIESNKQERAS